MPAQEKDTQHVHFEGPWTPEQQQRVSQAIEEFEALQSEGPFFGECPSWVCVLHELEDTTLLYAHRSQFPTVLSHTTAEGLAHKIRTAAKERDQSN